MTNSLRAIYRFWAMLIFAAVIVQVALAGYGAFSAAKKVGDGPNDTTPSLTNKQWDHGFGPHDALGYIIFLATILFCSLHSALASDASACSSHSAHHFSSSFRSCSQLPAAAFRRSARCTR